MEYVLRIWKLKRPKRDDDDDLDYIVGSIIMVVHCDIPNIESVNESGKAEPECQPPNRKTLGLFVFPGFVIGCLHSHRSVLSET